VVKMNTDKGLDWKEKLEFKTASIDYYFKFGKTAFYDDHAGREETLDVRALYDKTGNFWLCNSYKYYTVDEITLINFFKNQFSSTGLFLNSSIKNRVLEAFRQYGRVNYEKLKEIPKDCVCFQNAIVYVGNKECPLEQGSCLTDDPKNTNYTEATLDYFVTSPIDYDYDPRKEYSCPTIDSLFEDWVGIEKKELLYDLVAYCMLPDYPIHRIFILFGSGRNGKSTFMKILNKVIGKDNTCASDLKILTETPFGTAHLYKKLICYIGETNGNKLESTSVLKRLTGQDLVTAQYKNKPQFEFENYAKLIITTNVIPQTTDKTIGHLSKYIIIDFTKRYDERKDVFSEIPEEEFLALANLSVNRLRKILLNRKFASEPTLEQKIKIYEEKSNPLETYLSSHTELTNNPKDYIFCSEFYDSYISWLKINGYSFSYSYKFVMREVSEKNIDIMRKTHYDNVIKSPESTQHSEPKQYNAYIGIKWKPKDKLTVDTIESDNLPELDDKEYTSDEIYNHLLKKYGLPIGYNKEIIISKFKKEGAIFEPKTGVYKISQSYT